MQIFRRLVQVVFRRKTSAEQINPMGNIGSHKPLALPTYISRGVRFFNLLFEFSFNLPTPLHQG